MRVQLHRQRCVLVVDPGGDHRDRHPLRVQQRGAGMTSCAQLDVPDAGLVQGLSPLPGQHPTGARLAHLVAERRNVTSRFGMRRDAADFGSFSTERFPAATRLFVIRQYLAVEVDIGPPKAGDLSAGAEKHPYRKNCSDNALLHNEPALGNERARRVPLGIRRCEEFTNERERRAYTHCSIGGKSARRTLFYRHRGKNAKRLTISS
jgi:hypothetical protein